MSKVTEVCAQMCGTERVRQLTLMDRFIKVNMYLAKYPVQAGTHGKINPRIMVSGETV